MRALFLLPALVAGCFSKPDRVELRDGDVDAPSAVCSMTACAAANGTCQPGGWCEIATTNASDAIRCPSDMKCRVLCTGDGCKSRVVNCGAATECDVRCEGTNACQDRGVDCASAMKCDVRCIGANACQHGMAQAPSVHCRASSCTVTCDGANACDDGIDSIGGTCATHCCNDACTGGVSATCSTDMTCS